MSTYDWSYINNCGASWSLDTVKFVSFPSSLKLFVPVCPSGWSYGAMLTKNPSAQNLTQGMLKGKFSIHHWVWSGFADAGFIIGYKSPSDYQYFGFEWTPASFIDLRLSWWDSYDLQNNPATQYLFEVDTGSGWYTVDEGFITKLSGSVNRVGICGRNNWVGGTPATHWFDDTEIYI